MSEIIQCKNCVLDTTDPDISFDEKGICNYCHLYKNSTSKNWITGEAGNQIINNKVAEMKVYGKGKDYDCIIGLSGGIDSSYLAFLGKQLGLRMLAVHVDAGWNSELAVKNIENICKKLEIDLITEVIDWSVMKKLQLAFLKSGLVNQDIPQDHAFFAALYKYAEKNKIKYVLNGYNIATENTLPIAWRGPYALDAKLVKSVFKKMTGQQITGFPLINFWHYSVSNKFFKKYEIVDFLNNIDYNKNIAIEILKKEVDFIDYGGKHNESRFTKFHQNYFLVKKYGYEKRKAHLSSLINSNIITKEEALLELKKPFYSDLKLEIEDIEYISKKLGISLDEFNKIMTSQPMQLSDFGSSQVLFAKVAPTLKKIYQKIKK